MHSLTWTNLSNPGGAIFKSLIGEFISPDSVSANPQRLGMTARYSGTAAINALQFAVSSGTYSAKIRIYGVPK